MNIGLGPTCEGQAGEEGRETEKKKYRRVCQEEEEEGSEGMNKKKGKFSLFIFHQLLSLFWQQNFHSIIFILLVSFLFFL